MTATDTQHRYERTRLGAEDRAFRRACEVVARLGYDVACTVGFDTASTHRGTDRISFSLHVRVTCLSCAFTRDMEFDRRGFLRTTAFMRRYARQHKKSGACARHVQRMSEENGTANLRLSSHV